MITHRFPPVPFTFDVEPRRRLLTAAVAPTDPEAERAKRNLEWSRHRDATTTDDNDPAAKAENEATPAVPGLEVDRA